MFTLDWLEYPHCIITSTTRAVDGILWENLLVSLAEWVYFALTQYSGSVLLQNMEYIPFSPIPLEHTHSSDGKISKKNSQQVWEMLS